MKFSSHLAAWLLATVAPALAHAASDLTPNDFAYGMPLQLSSEAAIYNLPVPREVYQHTLRTDLGDLRVFNGDGEAVTYSLSTPLATLHHESLIAVPLFPLRGDPERALDRVKITIASAQGDVNLQTSRETTPAKIQAYVIDLRKFDRTLSALELHWPDDAAEFSGHVDVESSDDLGSWRNIANNLPIVNLKFGEQQLKQNRLEFTAVKPNYLRLRWIDQAAPFAITEILAEAAPTQTEARRTQAEIVGTAVANQTDTYDFTLDFHAPIDRINLKLPQTNTIANVTLSSRAQADQPWQAIATLRVYELLNNGTSLRNATSIITTNTDRYWRVHADAAGSLGKGTPTLQVAWLPQELTFVARGKGPFQLGFGNVSARAATSPLQNLLADPRTPISVATATVGELHELGGTARLITKRELPWKTWSLWAVLIIAVGVLGTVAYRLSREMSN